LYRPDDTPQLRAIVEQARTRGIPVIYDTDDLTWDERIIEYAALERYHGIQSLPDFRNRIQRERTVLSLADVCVTSTEYLAGLVRADTTIPVYVNQNAIDEQSIYLTQPLFHDHSEIKDMARLTIAYFSGWAQAHEIDFAIVTGTLQRILADLPHARLRVVGHFDIGWLPPELQSQIDVMPFVPYEKLFEAIAAADINIAPLVDNPHRRSKSAVKFLEAALVGVPTVAADLEPYRMIRHGETGYLAANADDWYAGIMALAGDAHLRQRIGQAARVQVLAEHTTTVRAAGYAAILHEVVKRKA
jgi:glycosyltransferase involved in cell wall biosynthesis